MIRAVTRYTLEISKPSSPYFERAICFVKPEFAQNDRLDLHRAAQQLIASFDSDVEDKKINDEAMLLGVLPEFESVPQHGRVRQRLMRLLPLAVSALGGAAAALLIVLLV